MSLESTGTATALGRSADGDRGRSRSQTIRVVRQKLIVVVNVNFRGSNWLKPLRTCMRGFPFKS